MVMAVMVVIYRPNFGDHPHIRNPMKKMVTCGFCRKDSYSFGGLWRRGVALWLLWR